MTDGNVTGIKNTQWLINQLNTEQERTRDDYETLFSTSFYNGGDDAKKQIQGKIDTLKKEWESLAKQLKEAKETLELYEGQMAGAQQELADTVKLIVSESGEHAEETEAAINQATLIAIQQTKQNAQSGPFPGITYGTTTFEEQFKLALDGLLPPSNRGLIESLYSKRDSLSQKVQLFSKKLETAINGSVRASNRIKNVEIEMAGLQTIKNKHETLAQNKIKNQNNTTTRPVYSIAQEEVIAGLAENLRGWGQGEIANTGTAQGRDEDKINQLKEDLKGLLPDNIQLGGDRNSMNGNNVMAALNTALFGEGGKGPEISKDSIIYKMAEAGANNIEILDAICSTFGKGGEGLPEGAGLNIFKTGENSYSIPWGHGEGAKAVVGAVQQILNNTAGLPEVPDRPQVNSDMVKDAQKALDTMVENGFNFKQAMFALDALFPGLDIGYNLAEQTNGDHPQGFVKLPEGDDYAPLAQAIKDYCEGTNGKEKVWENSHVVVVKGPSKNVPGSSDRTDPISVKMTEEDGSQSRVYFVADDGDGQFEGISDLAGSGGEGNEGMGVFEEGGKYAGFINPETGKIDQEEQLKQITVMKLVEVPDPNNPGQFTQTQQFMSAWDAGITEIDPTSAKESGKNTINGTEVQNTFNVKVGDQTLVAEQSLENNEYLEATLNSDALTGNKISVSLTSDELSNILNNTRNIVKEMFPDLDFAGLDGAISYIEQNRGIIMDKIKAAKNNPEIPTLQEYIASLNQEDVTIDQLAKMGDEIYGDIGGASNLRDNVYMFDASMLNDEALKEKYAKYDGSSLASIITENLMEEVRKSMGLPFGYNDPEFNEFIEGLVDVILKETNITPEVETTGNE